MASDLARQSGPGPAATRQRLMDTAVRLVSERGLRGVKITELATLAGLTTGAVYGNFRDKDDLLAAALLDDHTRKITADLAVLRMVVNEPSIRDLFSMVFTPEPNVRRILHITTFQTVHRNRNRTRELMVAHHQLVAEMERVIAHSAADGTVTLDDGVSPYLAAYLTQILPLGLLVVLGPTADWATDPVIAEVRNLYRRLFGYKPLPTTPPPMPAVPPPTPAAESELRARLIRVADEEIAERGTSGFRVQSVLRGAGVSTSVLYRLFGGRDELVAASLLEEHFGPTHTGDGVPDISDLFSNAHATRHIRHIDAFVSVTSAPHLADALTRAQTPNIAAFASTLERAALKGSITPTPFASPITLAYLLAAIPIGLTLTLGPDTDWTASPLVAEVQAYVRRLTGIR